MAGSKSDEDIRGGLEVKDSDKENYRKWITVLERMPEKRISKLFYLFKQGRKQRVFEKKLLKKVLILVAVYSKNIKHDDDQLETWFSCDICCGIQTVPTEYGP
jgi:hypothetical protein